jgi:hypothetical protein
MDITEFLRITPESLAKEQYDALKAHSISVLENIIELIKTENYSMIDSLLETSPAGDGYGRDNHYINFGHIDYYNQYGADIREVVDRLMGLKKLCGGDKNDSNRSRRK